MKYTNGFFQLEIKNDGVYMHIFPEQDGGKKIVVQEVAEYLEKCGIRDYNLPELNNAILKAHDKTVVFVSPTKISEVNEMAKVRITDDRMMAVIRFYPPSTKGQKMVEKDIMNELKAVKVTFGISTKTINAYIMGRQYCRDIVVAKGQPMELGKDATVLYKFNTNPTAKPQLLEDGSVDFHQLNLFTSVKKDALLAQLVPEVEGKPGKDVFGNVVNPPKVRKKTLKHGRNIRVSNDGLKMYSEVDGDVKLEGDTVFVSNTFVVPADVDTSTGDIQYNGNVVVTGNVRAGFTVEAAGDIEVNGVVEGAFLKAGGNIVLKRGMQGMSKGTLEAGTDIVTKFLESCTAKAGNSINTGASLHSNLFAKNSIIVSGKKGFLIGGDVSAGSRIEASVFGNKMNTATSLRVGVEPEVLNRFKELTVSIKEKQEEMLKQRQVLEMIQKKVKSGQKVMPNQLMMAKQAGELYKEIEEQLDSDSEEYLRLKKEIEDNTDGRVLVNNTIFPGVCIYISNRIYPIKENLSRCQFRLDGSDVIRTSL